LLIKVTVGSLSRRIGRDLERTILVKQKMRFVPPSLIPKKRLREDYSRTL